MWKSSVSIFLVILSLCVQYITASPAFYELCSERTQNSKDIKVDVSECNSDTRCQLLRGSTANFTIIFTPTVDTNSNLERVILAKFPNQKNNVEVPYGGALEVKNGTKVLETLTEIEGTVKKNTPLIHNYLFPVMKGAPPASLTVRYVIREKVEDVPRNQKHWKLHPGTILICIEIPVQLI